ncbi:MAG TPA: MaoC family dehydratase N-terminal domain-containing protein [bacterium]|nr:MaoC family dehydratase N-terminal domain-containing protein [bacterium]
MGALLTEEHRARVGTATSPVTETVTRREIRRYAVATRQRATRYLAGDEAPPLFFQRFFEDIPSLDELQPNGQPSDPLTHGLPLRRQMAGGSRITFHRPIRPGDTLTATRTLTGLEEKHGRTGAAIFCTIEMRVTDADARPVVTEQHTRILR